MCRERITEPFTRIRVKAFEDSNHRRTRRPGDPISLHTLYYYDHCIFILFWNETRTLTNKQRIQPNIAFHFFEN